MFENEYATEAEIPNDVKYLYRENNGAWRLIQNNELKTVDDINRLQESLRKERLDHKTAKGQLSAFGSLDPDEVFTKLDRIAELEAAAGGNIDETKINEMVETRIKSKTAPLERQLSQLSTEREDLLGKVSEYEGKEKRRTIHDQIRKAATSAKIINTAMEDALIIGQNIFDIDDLGNVVTRDGVGVTPGVEPSVWFSEIKQTRPHWWPTSQGAGATGGSGGNSASDNPWAKGSRNLTEQGKILRADRENGTNRAEQLAKAAGTTVTGR